MDSTEIYTLYAAAALVGLVREGKSPDIIAEFADRVAREMIALQAKWARENGL